MTTNLDLFPQRQPGRPAGSAGWTLKQVQGDEIARDRMGFLQ